MSDASWPSLWRIDQDKIGRYLLNPNHPEGGPKARFFRSFGFSSTQPTCSPRLWPPIPGTTRPAGS